jgi:hypothetical protein
LFSRTSFYVPGVYPVTVKATDMSGNTSSCVIRVEACYSNSIQTAPLKSGEIGVEPRFITDISVYPNPTEGLFSLDVSNLKNQEVYVRIFNITGSLVFDKKYSTEGHIEVNITGNPSGIYMLKLIADEKEFIKRLVLKD